MYRICSCVLSTPMERNPYTCESCFGVIASAIDLTLLANQEIGHQQQELKKVDERISQYTKELFELQTTRERLNESIKRLTKQRDTLETKH